MLRDHSWLRWKSPMPRIILSTFSPENGQEPFVSTRNAPRLILFNTTDKISICTDFGQTESHLINVITHLSANLLPITKVWLTHHFWTGWTKITLVFTLILLLSESTSLKSTELVGMLRELTSLCKITRTNISVKFKPSIRNMISHQLLLLTESFQAILRPTLLLKFRMLLRLHSMPPMILSDWNVTELIAFHTFSESISVLTLTITSPPANVLRLEVTHVMPPRMSLFQSTLFEEITKFY